MKPMKVRKGSQSCYFELFWPKPENNSLLRYKNSK